MKFSVSDLRDLRLTLDEWHSLFHMGEFDSIRAHMDMLVLAGLVVRTSVHPPEWDLTDAGHAACDLIDQVFDWDAFAFVVSEVEETEPTEIINLQVPMFV